MRTTATVSLSQTVRCRTALVFAAVAWLAVFSGACAGEDAAAMENQFRTAMEQGATYARQGNHATALAKFKRACVLKPMSAEALYRLALTYCDAQMYSGAENTARKATLLDPQHAGAWLVLGTSLFYLDREDEAVAHLEKAFALSPTNAHAPYLLGRCYYFGGRDRAKAVEFFKRALELDPRYVPAAFMLACCYMDGGLPGAAAKLFDAVLREEPGNVEARLRLGVCAIREKRFDDAEKSLQEVIRQHDRDFRAHLYLADIFLSYRGEKAFAILHYERFMELSPSDTAERKRVAEALASLKPDSAADGSSTRGEGVSVP